MSKKTLRKAYQKELALQLRGKKRRQKDENDSWSSDPLDSFYDYDNYSRGR